MNIEFVKAPIQNKHKEVTPTTEDIRYSYVEGPWGEGGEQAFDRWLVAHERQAKEQAWGEGQSSGISFQAGAAYETNPYAKDTP